MSRRTTKISIDKALCELRLSEFVSQMWPVLEPGRPFTKGKPIEAVCEHLEAIADGEIKRLVINIPPGCTKPVSVSQWVSTQFGRKRLGDIEVGDRVLTHKGRYRKVVAVHEQGDLPIISITTASGRVLRTAPDHPFLTPDGWTAAEDLEVHDTLALVREPIDERRNLISDQEARFIGYLVGDGAIAHAPVFINQDQDVLDDFELCAKSLGISIGQKHQRGKAWAYSLVGSKPYLESLGLLGKTSYTKTVPDVVMNSGRSVIENFVGAYFACNGNFDIKLTKSRGSIFRAKISTVGKQLAEQTHYLMWLLGINARIRVRLHKTVKSKRQPNGYVSYDAATQNFSETALFKNMPGLGGRKSAIVGKLKKRTFERAVLTPDEIVEIEHCSPEPCRCLTVEEDNSFTISNIAVHNSMLTNVFWPCWIWGPRKRPSTRFLSIAYNAGLTVRDNRRSRTLLESDEFQRMWPHVSLNPHEQNVQKFSNLQQGFRMASSTGGRVMGERADIVVIDDPNDTAKVESEMAIEGALQFFTEVLPTRINDPKNSCMVVIMQRVHARDISGFILSQELGWDHLCLPMWYEKDRHCVTSIGFEDWRREEGELLWPERFDKESLARDVKIMKAWGGDFAIAGQMQQRPVGREGGMFKKKYFEIVDSVPGGGRAVRGWDLAATSKAQNPRAAYTTGVKAKLVGGVLYVMDAVRFRKEAAQVEELLYQCAIADGSQVTQDFPQDPGQSGKSQKLAISRRLEGFDVRFSPETGDKVNRAIPLSAKGELGLIKVLRGPWNEDFLSEITMFPRGDYKDQVDALSRCYARLLVQPTISVPAKPMLVTVKADAAVA